MSSIQNTTAQAAALPFRIIESLGIPCGYERSFKLSYQRLLANRYILGFDKNDVTREQLMDACRQLKMPNRLLEEFLDGLPVANTVFFGFEDNEPGSIYKIYLEYWDQLKQKLTAGSLSREPHLLHKGFKWHIDAPENNRITLYQCLPGIEIDEIRQRIENIYRDLLDAKSLNAIREIIAVSRRRRREKQYIFVEVSESGNPRKSFDLNLYPAGMRVGHIADRVTNAAGAFEVPSDKLQRLMPMIRNKFFGHISGGISRTGEEYFTIYYEN